jgi:hypothetical protein
VAVLDLRKRKDAHAAQRLRDELIVWLTTVSRHGQPRSSPVWFWWDGDAEGRARIVRDGEPATSLPAYVDKYQRLIGSYGWTSESFAADYAVPILVRPTGVRIS